MLVNPDVGYRSKDGFLASLCPGAFITGLDLQDCFLRRLVFRASRLYLGERNPVWGRDGRCVGQVLRVTVAARPLLLVMYFKGDLRMVGSCGTRNRFSCGMARFQGAKLWRRC